ncbi:MAG: FliA/WhiG family RNA polymerase sigma factor [Actinomycetes bacterium]|jgi:RNA polymerase sigma factor for flagellar operon FliA|nr:MAG: RNA polymerase sigma factor WhiG [Actinomycetota bacterium]
MSAATHEPEQTQIEALWVTFKETRDPGIRERLILHYSPLVKYVAGRVGAGLPRSVDQGDLASYGLFGLIDAIDRFEPDRGFKFETYAINRIRGAILDELRALDWVPRSVRARARRIETAVGELEHKMQRTPTEEEIAEFLEMPLDELRDALAEIGRSGMAALDEFLSSDSLTSMGDMIADPGGLSPEQAFQAEETRRALVDAINRLPHRDRLVITLYYYEGMTLAEIGEVLGVTESRVCQIHAKTMMSLRNRLQ